MTAPDNNVVWKDVSNKLDEHIKQYNYYVRQKELRENNLLRSQEINSKNIADLTEATKGLVQAWEAMNTIHKFFRWLAGFAGLGAFIAWVMTNFPFG